MTLDDARAAPLRRHRPFALYWVSRVSSTVALQMQAVAVAWQMYDLTRNPLDLGLVGLTQFIPAALFVLVAGHAADRYDRRAIVRICQLTCGLATATLTVDTGSCFDVALRFKRANTALQEEIGAFTARQFALGTNVTSHFSLSPVYTRRFFGGRHPLCGIGVTSVMLAIL